MTNQDTRLLSGSVGSSFADRFGHGCRAVILPALRGAVIRRAQACPSPALFQVREKPGRTATTTDGSFDDNRRVALVTTPNVGELWFIAWDPYVLVFSRRGCALARHHRLEEITPAMVEEAAHEFMNGIPAGEPRPTRGGR